LQAHREESTAQLQGAKEATEASLAAVKTSLQFTEL